LHEDQRELKGLYQERFAEKEEIPRIQGSEKQLGGLLCGIVNTAAGMLIYKHMRFRTESEMNGCLTFVGLSFLVFLLFCSQGFSTTTNSFSLMD
jgi:hypothetical protein